MAHHLCIFYFLFLVFTYVSVSVSSLIKSYLLLTVAIPTEMTKIPQHLSGDVELLKVILVIILIVFGFGNNDSRHG